MLIEVLTCFCTRHICLTWAELSEMLKFKFGIYAKFLTIHIIQIGDFSIKDLRLEYFARTQTLM